MRHLQGNNRRISSIRMLRLSQSHLEANHRNYPQYACGVTETRLHFFFEQTLLSSNQRLQLLPFNYLYSFTVQRLNCHRSHCTNLE